MMKAQNDDSTILEQNDWIIRVNRFLRNQTNLVFEGEGGLKFII